MNHSYWNDSYFSWGWVLWLGFIFLMFSSFGNWGYTYRAHQKYADQPTRRAFDILDERYARGEIDREQYARMKSDIAHETGIVQIAPGAANGQLAARG